MLFLWLVLLQLVIFAALVFFLRVILTKNITSATTHLHSLNADYTQKIEDARKRQVEAEKYYDDTILKSKTDAEKTKVQILKEAHDAQEAAINESRRQSKEIIDQATKARELMVSEFDARVQAKALELAAGLVQEMLPGQISRKMHAFWVEDLLATGLDDLGRLHVADALSIAEVISAYELEPAQKKVLLATLAQKMGRKFDIVEKTDPALIAGFKVVLGTVVIDGTLRYKIKESTRHAGNAV